MIKRKLKVNLAPLIRKLEVMTKREVTSKMIGGYKSVFKGVGLEFEDYRAYSPGEDASKIDWKASSRANKILVKTYKEERSLEVFFIIDVSSNMVFGSADKLKNEYAAELIVSLAYIILRSGDKVGFLLFNDKEVLKSLPARGNIPIYTLIRSLIDPTNYGGQFNIVKAIDSISPMLKKSTLVLVISDFLTMPPKWTDLMKSAQTRLDIICLAIRDQRDNIMPADSYQVILENPVTGKQVLVDPKKIKEDYEDYNRQKTKQIQNSLAAIGIDFVELATDKPFVTPIIELFKRRAKRWT